MKAFRAVSTQLAWAIPFGAVCEGLRELSDHVEPPAQVAFPQLDGGSVALSPDRARWVEEQFEPVHMNPRPSQEQEELEDAF